MNEIIQHLLQAIAVGITQGLTEFIPISSSGHLILARELMGLGDLGLVFDAVLHLATLLAVLIYFRADWLKMITTSSGAKSSKTANLPIDRRLLGLLIVATIPGLIVGYFGNDWIQNNFQSLEMLGILFIFTGLVFVAAERWFKIPKTNKRLSFFDALNIGIGQAIAILPSVSRSGSALVAGLYVGLNRETAAKFSFLMSVPIVAAAGGYSLYKAISQNLVEGDYLFWTVAFISALLSGLVVIRWLLNFFKKHSLHIFAYYSILLGIGLVVYAFLR